MITSISLNVNYLKNKDGTTKDEAYVHQLERASINSSMSDANDSYISIDFFTNTKDDFSLVVHQDKLCILSEDELSVIELEDLSNIVNNKMSLSEFDDISFLSNYKSELISCINSELDELKKEHESDKNAIAIAEAISSSIQTLLDKLFGFAELGFEKSRLLNEQIFIMQKREVALLEKLEHAIAKNKSLGETIKALENNYSLMQKECSKLEKHLETLNKKIALL